MQSKYRSKEFLHHLSQGQSNQPEIGNGEEIYRRFVKPKSVTPERVVNQYAISSLFDKDLGQQRPKLDKGQKERPR
jgi:hypothetical protein